MYFDYFFSIAKDDMTFPNSNRPKLMFIPYLRVFPVAPVFFNL